VLWGRSEVTQIFLTGTRLMRREPEGKIVVSHHEHVQQAATSLKEILSSAGSRELRIWLGGQLCRVAMATPIEGARDRAELDAALTAALRSRGVAREDEVARSISFSNNKSAIAIALIRVDVLDAVEALRTAGVTVRSVRPWWSRYADEFARGVAVPGRSRVFAAFDEEVLTTLSVEPSQDIRMMATHDLGASLESARKVMTRLTSLQQDCHVLCLSLNAERAANASAVGAITAVDFGFAAQVVSSETF